MQSDLTTDSDALAAAGSTPTGGARRVALPGYLAAADVCVAPYRAVPPRGPFVNSPIKLFEYMAAGRAIVASRIGQIAEILADERSALLVEPEDSASLAAALARRRRALHLAGERRARRRVPGMRGSRVVGRQ